MTTLFESDSSLETNDTPTAAAPPKVPRLDSLLHRVQHAKDAEGRPIQLLDELLFFLEDPPPGTGDRWQQGADLCASHGIQTSRMAVWRLYRAQILQWRREQNPAPPEPAPSAEEIERLHDQARYLAVQRMLEMLHDPRLSPGHLIGLLQADNQRQKLALARDQFNERVAARHRLEEKERLKRMDKQASNKALGPLYLKLFEKIIPTEPAVPPHTTS